MKTVYYNYYAFEGAKASGGEERRAVLVRQCAPRHGAPVENNVISLDDYRARRPSDQPEEPIWEALDPPGEPRSDVKEKLMLALELACCAAIIAVAAVACAAFLL